MIYVVPLSDPQITIYYTAMALFSIAFLPLINFTTNKLGKKKAFILLNGIPVVGIAIFYFINLYSFSSLMIYGLIMGLANGAFWTLCYSMAYDVITSYSIHYTKLYDYLTRKRNQKRGVKVLIRKIKMTCTIGFSEIFQHINGSRGFRAARNNFV